MPPVVAAIGWGGILAATTAAVSAGTAIYSTVQSSRQADKAAKRQDAYYNQLQQEQASTAAKEKQITDEARERSRLYGASLLDTGTQLQNMLSGGYDDDEYTGGSVLTNTLGSAGVGSIFA